MWRLRRRLRWVWCRAGTGVHWHVAVVVLVLVLVVVVVVAVVVGSPRLAGPGPWTRADHPDVWLTWHFGPAPIGAHVQPRGAKPQPNTPNPQYATRHTLNHPHPTPAPPLPHLPYPQELLATTVRELRYAPLDRSYAQHILGRFLEEMGAAVAGAPGGSSSGGGGAVRAGSLAAVAWACSFAKHRKKFVEGCRPQLNALAAACGQRWCVGGCG